MDKRKKQSPVEGFMRLFSGYSGAYGQWETKGKNDRGKVAGKAKTIKGTLTETHYAAHLAGLPNPGLGVIMLREDNTCYFGAIDIDDPTTDHVKLEEAIESHKLKLNICRSKSGGAHLYVFTCEPVPASLLQRKLQEWAALLGFSAKTEIFPKQTSRANEQDIGNWINLPYYSGTEKGIPERALMYKGKWQGLDDFVAIANKRLVSEADLEETEYGPGTEEDEMFEGPPCLQHIYATGGLVVGTKRDGMFDVAVYLRKRFPDDWEKKLGQYNTFFGADLAGQELTEIGRAMKKGDGTKYSYKCKQPPINAHCQRKLCLTRKFGVGDVGPEANGIQISDVIKYQVEGTDECMWSVEIMGQRIWLTNDELYSKDAFNKKCMATINRSPLSVTPLKWNTIMNELIAHADTQYTSRDTSETGNLEEWIKRYLRGAKCNAKEQIVVSGAFLTEGHVKFKALDLFQYLSAHRVELKKGKQQAYKVLGDMGGKAKPEFISTKLGTHNVWTLPAPEGTDADFEVPSFEQKTPF